MSGEDRPTEESKAPEGKVGSGQAEGKRPVPGKLKSPAKPTLRKAQKAPVYMDLENDPLFDDLRSQFADGIVEGKLFLDQSIYTVELDQLLDLVLYLKDSPQWNFDYLLDLTALDYLGDKKRFCVVYHLYSIGANKLIRIKVRVEEGAFVPSLTSVWPNADWLEREVYDLFGIVFSGHKDLRRILLPEDWHGHPLRKDYDIKLQDQAWIKSHLQIRKTPV